MTIEDRIKLITAEQLGVRLNEVTSETTFIHDLGADSLDMVEFGMMIEEEFNIEIPDEEMGKMQKIEDIIHYVKSKISV